MSTLQKTLLKGQATNYEKQFTSPALVKRWYPKYTKIS